ncbi:MAG TPA: hypothetical protein PKD80_17870 [Microthrixaceae bacterium]|jgi:hypothetical protein|nr:hypothetical protein [Actinomycetota bacterium]HMS14970.1 hypothetical protein [Microthrixaceae bacterium]HMT24671.1 hypothetical protein [Microthrixaceae bacterium]HMT60698.1 hypothetical protein [Microthrixaceae bacterium]
MILRARFAVRALRDIWRYGVRTGQWWLPVIAMALTAATAAAAAAHAAVPTAIYTLF